MSTEPETTPPSPDTRSPETRSPETLGPDAAAAGTPEALMEAASARIVALETELEDMKDRWMRAEAETANTRNRGRREVEDARQYAVQSFAKDVVEAAENIRRGLDALPAASDNDPALVTQLRAGFEGVERSFLALLERHGIARTDPTGAAFDPNLHQAMSEQETLAHPSGTVIQAWTPAWTLHGRLLRAAMVVVAKAPPTDLPGEKPAEAGLDRTV